MVEFPGMTHQLPSRPGATLASPHRALPPGTARSAVPCPAPRSQIHRRRQCHGPGRHTTYSQWEFQDPKMEVR